MKKYFVSIFLVAQIFAFGGFGLYINSDTGSTTPISTTTGAISVIPGEMKNPIGIGGFIYLDVIPVIDIEISAEFIGKEYPFDLNTALTESPYMFPWGRLSIYSTVRKKIIGASIPFLAKVQIYGGLGANTHWVTPDITVDFIEGAFPDMSLDAAAEQSFNNQDILNTLTEYMNENMRTVSGAHLQVGMQAKLLMFNVFVNGRYTLAKDVINGTSGFPSVWMGLAFGL